ncbi:MAG TPA: trehalose-phosphatase [Acidimicrobiales bacterium]|nr:trehalose-phosphatase [Acidimicrobiales bacterium]
MSPAETARELDEQLRLLTTEPTHGALFCDIDGTLAPIVDRPSEAYVPEEVSRLLGRLGLRYACVACVSGRPALEARQLVGERRIFYAGLHGAELLSPEEEKPRLVASFQDWQPAVRVFSARQATQLQTFGVRLEDKGPIAAFHWRGVPDEEAALAQLRRVAGDARAAGLSTRWGRKVLEVWPPVLIGKGRAVCELVGATGARTAMYGGDDVTDLDAFSALDALVADGRLDAAVRVGVRSDEGPPEIIARADVVAEGVPGFRRVLERLQ